MKQAPVTYIQEVEGLDSQFRSAKKMGELGGQNAHSTLNTDCESGV